MDKFYGNIDLRALFGAQIVVDEEGRECIQIPIDLAKLRRSSGHVYLPFFMFEKPKFNYKYMITRSQTKEEREERKRTEFLGNAIDVVNNYTSAESNPGEAAPKQQRQKPEDDEPF